MCIRDSFCVLLSVSSISSLTFSCKSFGIFPHMFFISVIAFLLSVSLHTCLLYTSTIPLRQLKWQFFPFRSLCRNKRRTLFAQQFYGICKFPSIYFNQEPQCGHATDISGFPMPFAGQFIDFKTVMILSLIHI